MNDPHELESMLHRLRPGALPQDLRQRLATPPTAPMAVCPVFRRPLFVAFAAMAAAASVAFLLRQPEPSDSPPAPLSLLHQESTLIATRVLGYVERDGRMWSLAEQQWQDDELAACSDSPVSLRRSSERRELVYQPVSFD
jgi:hypothetical protein